MSADVEREVVARGARDVDGAVRIHIDGDRIHDQRFRGPERELEPRRHLDFYFLTQFLGEPGGLSGAELNGLREVGFEPGAGLPANERQRGRNGEQTGQKTTAAENLCTHGEMLACRSYWSSAMEIFLNCTRLGELVQTSPLRDP